LKFGTDLLLQVYPNQPDVIHRNLFAVVRHLSDMSVYNNLRVCQLVKEVATLNPQVSPKAIFLSGKEFHACF